MYVIRSENCDDSGGIIFLKPEKIFLEFSFFWKIAFEFAKFEETKYLTFLFSAFEIVLLSDAWMVFWIDENSIDKFATLE